MNPTQHGATLWRRLILSGLCAATAYLPVSAQTATPPPASAPAADDEVVQLSPFTVSTSSDDRYRAGDAISAVRVRSALIDTPSSILGRHP